MEDQFLEGLRSLERQAFVNYVAVADKNGYSIAASGDANRTIASYIREIENCAESIFPDTHDIKIVVEGPKKSVIIGQQDGFIVGVEVTKELF